MNPYRSVISRFTVSSFTVSNFIVSSFIISCLVVGLGGTAPAYGDARVDALLDAAQRNENATVKKLLEEGVDVDSKNRYGATALFFASEKGNLELVRFLLDKGAEVNLTDTFYQASPLTWALFSLEEGGDYKKIVLLLLEKGAEDAASALTFAVRAGDLEVAKAAVATGRVEGIDLAQAHALAEGSEQKEIAAFLADKVPVLDPQKTMKLEPKELERYVGQFKNEQIGMDIKIFIEGGELKAHPQGQEALTLDATAKDEFSAREFPGIELTFGGRGGLVEQFILKQRGQEFAFLKAGGETPTEVAQAGEAEGDEALPEPAVFARKPPMNWPSFRGPNASGIGDGQGIPTEWDPDSGKNVRWKTPIPGIALASPIVWGDRVFLTTAVSEGDDTTFRTGLYGDVDSVDDDSVHSWRVYALDRATGEVLWEREAAKGTPKAKRHLKSSHANPTAVTDGKYLVTHFASEGIFCYDFDGKLLWKKDLGVLSSGWFYDATYEWGFSSSPILFDGKVIVQTDIQKGSFIAAFTVETGKELWRTARDEIPTWGTPSILPAAAPGQPDEIITNGTTIRGYDANSGAELWTLAPNSEVTVGTPVVADGMAFVTGGYPPARPIYAIRPGGRGDLSLDDDATSSQHIAWSLNPGGTYIPTPIAYQGILYMLNNNGRLAAYDAKTGERIFRKRVGQADSFSGSPVASDGRLFITSEEGKTYVLQAGREYSLLATNELGEVVMTTPAISDGLLILRGMKHVYGIGTPAPDHDAEAEEGTRGGR